MLKSILAVAVPLSLIAAPAFAQAPPPWWLYARPPCRRTVHRAPVNPNLNLPLAALPHRAPPPHLVTLPGQNHTAPAVVLPQPAHDQSTLPRLNVPRTAPPNADELWKFLNNKSSK
jgi:hypothetical protein